jgi:uncharacterized protein YecT (DUF1311 family)
MVLGRTVILAAFLISSAAIAGEKDEFGLKSQVKACEKDQRFRVGGSAIGDCLLEVSDAVDRDIAGQITKAEARYCLPEDHRALQKSQELWAAYRDTFCHLVEMSPDNTPSYVNSAVCKLVLGRDRLRVLSLAVNYGSARCPVG